MNTKKIASLLLAFVMLLSITAGLGVSAYAQYSGDFYYELLEDDTAEILNYEGADEDLVIPSELDGYTVTSIGDYAFSGYEIASVEIPGSITSIGSGAFADCLYLTAITVDESNENYSTLDGILFNKDQSVLLAYPAGLDSASYSIPDGVTSIADGAFSGCEKLTTIDIPDSAENIGVYAFSNCCGLTSIELPDSLTSIDEGAFAGCYGLTEITIPAGVTSIGLGAFDGCELKAINVDENNENYSSQDGVLFNKDKTELVMYPSGLENSVYTIPDGVKSIASGAFAASENLTAVDIPDSVEYIGVSAFSYSGLTSITLPDSVKSIDDYAFSGCFLLADVVLGNGVTNIGDQAFGDCMSLTSIEIPDSVQNIGYMAFVFSGIKSAVIGNGVTNFDAVAFWNCDAFESLTILNKDCDITDENGVLKSVTIYGYTDSTAQAYAEKNGIKFIPIDEEAEEPATEEATTEEPTTDESTTTEPTTAEPTTAKPAPEPTTNAEKTTTKNTTDKSDTSKSPSTGAEGKALFAVAAMAIAGGAVIFARKKGNDQ